jgi:hypothetical protein
MRPIVTVVEGAASRKLLDFAYVRDMLGCPLPTSATPSSMI